MIRSRSPANSLWGQKGFPFRKAFLDRLAASYDAGMNVVDFTSQAEASRVAINDWVAQRTKGKITELLPEGVVTDLTRLVLVNAITFNASWTQPFDDARELPFTLADGTDTTAPLMAGGRGTIMDGAGWRAAAIPYCRRCASGGHRPRRHHQFRPHPRCAPPGRRSGS